ncbi:hypothetical protein CAC42_7977 [Sphaceloma murrayae]|uniref:Transmembrane protein 135 N-terminal domain-containing protein n=1 Tax=Sphaceloma murrayae TaxID=2082308 RepID=A0A2K1QLM9_9PEZI|nr:hypothetical protein CAC42_7977 [Sphaceloma murrayae]
MSSAPSEPASNPSSSSSSGSKRSLDPVFRNALRYTVSPREYELLHGYLLSRAPEQVKKRAPRPKSYAAMVKSGGEYNSDSIRAALRAFVAVYTGFKSWDLISQRLLRRKQTGTRYVALFLPSLGFLELMAWHSATTPPPPKGANARIAASFSLILLFHRLLFRFFTRLRASLLESSSAPFRERNPRVGKALTSSLTPAIGAALSGLFLSVAPASPLRITIAIYVLTRSLEFGFNALEESRTIFRNGRPSWFGSWLLMPVCYGQLLHAFVFDRDCFPSAFGDFILRRSPEYIQARPASHPSHLPYPSTYDIVDALALLSKQKWPAFTSPILFPASTKAPKQPTLARVAPLMNPAHPLTKHTSCALLHPSDPSCARVHLKYWLRAFPPTLRFLSLVYSAFALLSFRKAVADPRLFSAKLAERILRLAIFITGAIGSAWGSICLFNAVLPRTFLSTQRFFLGGMVGGSWAYVARRGERGNFLYCLRLSLDSFWKVGKRRGWWKGVQGGDVLVFTAAMAVLGTVYETRKAAVRGPVLRKGIAWARGEGWEDGVMEKVKGKGEKED